MPDPRDGFKDVLIRAVFSDGDMNDARTWDNSAMIALLSIKALVVLTAYMVRNKYGFAPMCSVYDDNSIRLYNKKDPYEKTRGILLTHDNMPVCILEAIKCISKELLDNYGAVDYLDT